MDYNKLKKKIKDINFILKIIRVLKNPIQSLKIYLDFYQINKKISFEVDKVAPNGKKVLIISLSNWIYQSKLQSMLILPFLKQGWDITVLTETYHHDSIKVFKTFGIKKFIYVNKYNPDISKKDINEIASNFLKDKISINIIKEWYFENVWIGPTIIASLSKKLFSGKIDFNDPEVISTIKHFLNEILYKIKLSKLIFKKKSFDIYLASFDVNYIEYAPYVDVIINQGKNVIQFHQPWNEKTLTFLKLNKKTRRFHPSIITKEEFLKNHEIEFSENHQIILNNIFQDRYNDKYILQSRNSHKIVKMSKDEILDKINFKNKKKVAVIYSHILWDTNLFFGEDLYDDYGQWLIETLKLANKNKEINWILKVHPANIWKYKRNNVDGKYAEIQVIEKFVGNLGEHVKILYPTTNIRTSDLFNISNYAITVRGTAGMEAPTKGITTILAGTGRYSDLGFTVDPKSIVEYESILMNLQKLGGLEKNKVDLAKKHALLSFDNRLWKMQSFKSIFSKNPGKVDPLDHNLLPKRKINIMEDNLDDLDKWYKWAIDNEKIIYLDPPNL